MLDTPDSLWSTSDIVTMAVQEGESLVLECNPSTNDPTVGNASVFWTKNSKFIHPNTSDNLVPLQEGNSLLVRNFSIPLGEDNVTITCLLSGLRYLSELRRTFTLTLAKGQSTCVLCAVGCGV